MTDLQILCVVQDQQGVIQRVGIGSNTHPVIDVVNWILNGTYSFYTLKNGYKARVYARQHSATKRWFLTTEPDNTRENNLDFLRKCY
jgi:hypothetical protein